MNTDRLVRIVAGTFAFSSAFLGYFHHRYWLFFTMFVGLNLFQYGFSRWCLMERLLVRVGVKPGASITNA